MNHHPCISIGMNHHSDIGISIVMAVSVEHHSLEPIGKFWNVYNFEIAPLWPLQKPKSYSTVTKGLFQSYISHICKECCLYLTNIPSEKLWLNSRKCWENYRGNLKKALKMSYETVNCRQTQGNCWKSIDKMLGECWKRWESVEKMLRTGKVYENDIRALRLIDPS